MNISDLQQHSCKILLLSQITGPESRNLPHHLCILHYKRSSKHTNITENILLWDQGVNYKNSTYSLGCCLTDMLASIHGTWWFFFREAKTSVNVEVTNWQKASRHVGMKKHLFSGAGGLWGWKTGVICANSGLVEWWKKKCGTTIGNDNMLGTTTPCLDCYLTTWPPVLARQVPDAQNPASDAAGRGCRDDLWTATPSTSLM